MKSIFLLSAFLICFPILSQEIEPGMVLITAGEFNMGKNTANPTDWQPEHRVQIDAFYIDKYEVTNKQYYEFCTKTKHVLPEFWGSAQFKSGLDYPDYPVVGVSSYDAEQYARWAGKRLPTEAEWEYAARGGLVDKSFPWGDQVDSAKVNYGKKFKSILKVGSFPANNFGLFDITGNVWEWTSDYYGDDYYETSPVENPKGPSSGRFRVIRGGSWHSGAMCVQTYYRNGLPTSWVDLAVGFRCVKSTKKEN
jgi:iron(II)-dependent oxidoreductase